jgi:hypothetical protein
MTLLGNTENSLNKKGVGKICDFGERNGHCRKVAIEYDERNGGGGERIG